MLVGQWVNEFHPQKQTLIIYHLISIPQLMEIAQESGVKLWPCQMTMDMFDLKRENLMDGLEEPCGHSMIRQKDFGSFKIHLRLDDAVSATLKTTTGISQIIVTFPSGRGSRKNSGSPSFHVDLDGGIVFFSFDETTGEMVGTGAIQGRKTDPFFFGSVSGQPNGLTKGSHITEVFP